MQVVNMRRTMFIPPRIERRRAVAALAAAAASTVATPLSTSSSPPPPKPPTARRNFVEDVHYRLVTREPGAVRFDLPIWAPIAPPADGKEGEEPGSPPPPMPLVSPHGGDFGPVVRTDVDGVPGAFVLSNVLTEDECDAVSDLSEAMGYTADAPVSLGRHIRRNENCVVIADDALWRPVWDRVESHLPPRVMGGAPAGLNQRWRLYRYGRDDTFRMHTDGSWPGSGLDGTTGRLVRDIYGDRWSRLTFLIYLDDDYDGGETTFHVPDLPLPPPRVGAEVEVSGLPDGHDHERLNGEMGRVVEPYDAATGTVGVRTAVDPSSSPVRIATGNLSYAPPPSHPGRLVSVRVPKGSVLCFPHGEHPLSPLHEGSLVTRGVKRIVRTDVLYTLPAGRVGRYDEL